MRVSRSIVCPHCGFAVPITGVGSKTVVKVSTPIVAKTPKAPAAGPSLKDILGDHYDPYWKVASIFGGAKNFAPTKSAVSYMTHIDAGISDLAIYTAASRLRAKIDDPKYLPQLVKWLEGADFTAIAPAVAVTPENPESRLTGRRMAE